MAVKKVQPEAAENVTDFDQILMDADGKPITEVDYDDKQLARVQMLQLTANSKTAPLADTAAALEELQDLNKKATRPTKIGTVCVNALWAADEKADGTMILSRHNLAMLIKGKDDDHFESVEGLSKKKKTLIEERVEAVYGKRSPILYVRVYEALEGNTAADDD